MIGNFVQETANAPGSAATVTLAGASPGRRGIIAAFGAGATVYLGMDDGTQWQLVEALTVAGPPQQITITTVINNSANTTNRLNFTGSVRIYSAIPAERNVYARPDGTIQGATATGDAVFRAADAAAARTAIGATATGDAVMTAADAEAARAAINAIANPHIPEVGERFLGTVVKLATFGAFVSLVPGKDGLLHVSELKKLAGKRVENVEEVLQVGQKVEVEITKIDDRGKLSLSPVVNEAE